MAMESTTASSGDSSTISRYLGTIRGSKPRQGVIIGFVLIGIGMILQDGVVAGMMGIYGATAIVISVTAHVALVFLRRKSDRIAE